MAAAGYWFQGGGAWRTTDLTYVLSGTNQWYQVVATCSGSFNLNLYVNTTLTRTASTTATPVSSNVGIQLMTGFSNVGYMGGRLSIARIYNRALSQSDINTNFNAIKGRYGLT
jgi:hypothetical protein